MEESQVVIAMYKADDGYFIMLNDDGNSIAGFTSEEDGCKQFTDSYDRKHMQSHEGSMSACLHYIMFHPVIITTSEAEIKKACGEPPYSTFQHRCVAGTMRGMVTTEEFGKALYEKGRSPSLITH